MSVGIKVLAVVGIVLIVIVAAFVAAVGLTGKRRANAAVALPNSPRVALHQRLASHDPTAADVQRRIAAYAAVLDDVARIRELQPWKTLRDSVGTRELRPDEWAHLKSFLDAEADLLAALRTAAAAGGPVGRVEFASLEHPHLLDVFDVVRLLCADAVLAERANDSDRIGADIVAALQWVVAIREEPLLFCQVVASSAAIRVVDAIETQLPPAVMNPEHEHKVIRLLHALMDRSALAEAYVGEAVFMQHHLESPEFAVLSDDEREDVGAVKQALLGLYVGPLGRPWFNVDTAHSYEALSLCHDLALQPYAATLEDMELLAATEASSGPTRVITSRSIGDYLNVLAANGHLEARLALTQAGLAVERYYAEKSRYPASLSGATAALPGGVPQDPFSGESLRYRMAGDSFAVYSRGPNLDDDGGVHDPERGDIVWRGGDL